ncbi:hypothetical protein V7S43_012386 [Phytophthora oleae]|uniref:Uncharacterized protein n=1 Tax=Phytophthora oleae TaxID=2107226 RepID=A0ABD3F9Z3_9STRA
MEVYSVPASTAGVKRNHKVAKCIRSAARNRMSSGKVGQQVAVAHNGHIAEMTLREERQCFEVFMQQEPLTAAGEEETPRLRTGDCFAANIATAGEGDEGCSGEPCSMDEEDDILAGMTEDEFFEQSAALALSSISLMPDNILFPEHEGF